MAGLEYKVFHGVGVVVAEVKSDTLFSVTGYISDDQFVDFSNIDLRFSVDMTRTPNRVGTIAWEKVLIDDRGIDQHGKELDITPTPMQFPLAITSIGAGKQDDPARGSFVGAVYLAHNVYQSLHDAKLAGWPEQPGDYKLIELTSIAYSNRADNGPRKGQRYHGFWAKVTEVQGNNITVEITERGGTRRLTFTVDDAQVYDPDPPSEALGDQFSLTQDLTLGASGALFIELKRAVVAQLQGPKLPIGEDI